MTLHANINEISGNTAEVILWDSGWFNGATVTAEIELDDSRFWRFLTAGIRINSDYFAPVKFGFLADFEPYINQALYEYDADRRTGEE